MKNLMNKIFLKQLAVVFTLVFSMAVFAIDLHDAKQQGLVGETETGYLEAVKTSKEAIAVVEEINDQRREEYQRIASKNNIPIAAVEALAGKKAIEKTPAGQYVKINGNWTKK